MNKFSNSKKFNKTNIKQLPESKPIIYEFKNNTNEDLYVGIAKRGRVQERLNEHLNKPGEKIPGVTKVKIAQAPNLEKAKIFEKQLIKKLKPKFNVKNKKVN